MIFVTQWNHKKFLQIISHTRQECITVHIIMKYSRLHKTFITKYLFGAELKKSQKIFAMKVWSYTVYTGNEATSTIGGLHLVHNSTQSASVTL